MRTHFFKTKRPIFNKNAVAEKTEYNGVLYASRYESQCAAQLDFRMAAGELESWEPQVPISLVVNGYEVAKYNLDFVAKRTDGVTEYIEAKGKAGDTPLWRLKWKILEAMMKGRKNVKCVILWQSPVVKGVKGGKLEFQSVGEIKKVKE